MRAIFARQSKQKEEKYDTVERLAQTHTYTGRARDQGYVQLIFVQIRSINRNSIETEEREGQREREQMSISNGFRRIRLNERLSSIRRRL